MEYWKAILNEVLNKDKRSTKFLYTNLGEVQRKILEEEAQRKSDNALPKKERKTYYLGKKSDGLYLTQREAECMNLLLQGHTIVSTAKMLNLSGRTVEFYVKNMKMKLSCATKSELVNKVKKTNFLENYKKENGKKK